MPPKRALLHCYCSHQRWSATVLQSLLWEQTAVVGQKSSDVVAVFVESMNQAFDLREKREMLRLRSRIPAGYVLYLLTITLLLTWPWATTEELPELLVVQ